MQADNFESLMQTFKRRRPFRSFTVAFVDGDRLEVDHPEALMIRDAVAIYFAPGGIPALFDHEGVSQVIGDLKA